MWMRIKPVMFLIITGAITVVVKKTCSSIEDSGETALQLISVKHFLTSLLTQSLILGHTKKKIKVPYTTASRRTSGIKLNQTHKAIRCSDPL